jgi:hypothetical protein
MSIEFILKFSKGYVIEQLKKLAEGNVDELEHLSKIYRDPACIKDSKLTRKEYLPYFQKFLENIISHPERYFKENIKEAEEALKELKEGKSIIKYREMYF